MGNESTRKAAGRNPYFKFYLKDDNSGNGSEGVLFSKK